MRTHGHPGGAGNWIRGRISGLGSRVWTSGLDFWTGAVFLHWVSGFWTGVWGSGLTVGWLDWDFGCIVWIGISGVLIAIRWSDIGFFVLWGQVIVAIGNVVISMGQVVIGMGCSLLQQGGFIGFGCGR